MKDSRVAGLLLFSILSPQQAHASEVTAGGRTHATIQAAVDSLPATGGEVTLSPGIYREKVVIAGDGVRLRGLGPMPQDAVIAWSDGAMNVGGTLKSATLHVIGEDFRADNLTVQNDYSLRFKQPSQAVALAVTGDRAILNRVRLLGTQDTLYAGSKRCGTSPCRRGSASPASRQYFRDCYIEGHVDFIFGDSKAFFERCEIHVIPHGEILVTAHGRTAPDQDRAFVFDHCLISGPAEARNVYLGRPWRDHAAVVFMNTRIDVDLHPNGWREWHPGETQRLTTAYFAEYRSSGQGSDVSHREPHALQLSDQQVERWSAEKFLAGQDGWQPGKAD